MLYEFAVDPSAVATWDSLRLLIEHFGIPHGRLICRLPKRWEDEVLKASDVGDMEKAKMTERLNQTRERLTRKTRTYEKGHTWLRNAEDSHASTPFRAIITTANPRNMDHILVADELHGDKPIWKVDREQTVSRESVAMASCADMLFQQSREILFVDPHFTPELRFTESLEQFLSIAFQQATTFRRLEYHTLHTGATLSWFTSECNKWLPSRIPKGVNMRFVRWKERAGGEAFHARYILTELGGLRFEHGLDTGPAGETTDVSLLDQTVYSTRYNNLDPAAPAYDYQDEYTVSGTKH